MRKGLDNLDDYRLTKSERGLGDSGKNKQIQMSGSAKKAPGTNVFLYYCMLSGFAWRIAWNLIVAFPEEQVWNELNPNQVIIC